MNGHNWQQIGEEYAGVSAWYDSHRDWLAIGVNPDWADSWIIGRPQRWFADPHGIDRLIDEWLEQHP